MLTQDEVELMAHAFALRAGETDDELWFEPTLDGFSSAVGLYQHGLLDRSWRGRNAVFRASDQAMGAAALTAGQCMN